MTLVQNDETTAEKNETSARPKFTLGGEDSSADSPETLRKNDSMNEVITSDSLEVASDNLNNETSSEIRKTSVYQQLMNDLNNNDQCRRELRQGKRIGFYRIRGDIGIGNFSLVKVGVHALTKEKVAIKILDKTKLDEKTQKLLSREITSMDRLHHPNIIRLFEVIDTLPTLNIVMEYAGGGDLYSKIIDNERLDELTTKTIFAQIVSAIEHMHHQLVTHRDLKAENVFFLEKDSNHVKIGDFGFSTVIKSYKAHLTTFCGSPPYAAPELFQDDYYEGPKVDIWAMGILLYFMITGLMPFRADTVGKLKKCIIDGIYAIPAYIPTSCQYLVRGILRHDPQERLTIKEIRSNSFLQGAHFPNSLEPLQLNPSNARLDQLKREEREAVMALSDFGITPNLMEDCQRKESRCSITGTYRIVLHNVQKKHLGDSLKEIGRLSLDNNDTIVQKSKSVNDIEGNNKSLPNDGQSNQNELKVKISKQPRSQFCAIL